MNSENIRSRLVGYLHVKLKTEFTKELSENKRKKIGPNFLIYNQGMMGLFCCKLSIVVLYSDFSYLF